MRLAGKASRTAVVAQKVAPVEIDKPPVADEPAFRFADDANSGASLTTMGDADAVSIIMEGIQEISTAMMGSHDINDIALMSLEIIYRALQCQRAVLFIDVGRSRLMEARYGYGKGVQRLVGKLAFEIGGTCENDLFLQSLKNGKDLIVDDLDAPHIRNLIPPWYHKTIDAKAFIFMPIAYQNVCVGAYYGDSAFSGQTINALEHKYLSMLRNQLILAIKMER
jgi:hypothetical protein